MSFLYSAAVWEATPEPPMAEDAKPARLSAADCRRQAHECRKMAEGVIEPAHETMLEHMADTWDRLAAEMDQRTGSAAEHDGSAKPPQGV
jgi:hypothetical protein